MDQIYLNAYVPKLQVGGQVVGFMTRHLGLPTPSPAVMEKIGTVVPVDHANGPHRWVRASRGGVTAQDQQQRLAHPGWE